MVSLEDRVNELCKGNMLLSPIWLARLIEEIFDSSTVKTSMKTAINTNFTENNYWPLLSASSAAEVSSSWSSTARSKKDSNVITRFLSPSGPLFTALRQSADAWVSVSFDAKYAQVFVLSI